MVVQSATMNSCLVQTQYETNEACLAAIFAKRRKPCSCGRDAWTPVKGRTSYACPCGKHLNPLVGTIFQGSKLPLKTWFYVMYLFANAKSGLSAMFVSRITGIGYNAAWRMLHKIRELMADTTKIRGHVQADETFFTPKAYKNSRVEPGKWFGKGKVLFGAVSSSGKVRVKVIKTTSKYEVNTALTELVAQGSHVHTDGGSGYMATPKYGFKHTAYIHYKKAKFEPGVNHFQPVSGKSTQRIENFWAQLKRGIYGVYRSVKYLQAYAQEFAYRYRRSGTVVFEGLVRRV